MKNFLIALLISLSFSCSNKEEKNILDNKLEKLIVDYINENPINDVEFIKVLPQSSYQIFFDKVDKDTVFAIKLLPHLTSFNIIDFYTKKDSLIYEIRPKGIFYIKKNPIIFFDTGNYSKYMINSKRTSKNIPNNFKSNEFNAHLKSKMENYRLLNGTFIKVNGNDR